MDDNAQRVCGLIDGLFASYYTPEKIKEIEEMHTFLNELKEAENADSTPIS